MLPAAALIYVNFHHLKSIKRDKNLEASIHRDFQYMLSVSEKKINEKIYTMTEEMRDVFPSPDADTELDKGRKLDLILSKNPRLAHAFLFDAEKGYLFRSQPQQMTDRYCREEHDRLSEMFRGWFGMDAKMLCDGLHNKSRAITLAFKAIYMRWLRTVVQIWCLLPGDIPLCPLCVVAVVLPSERRWT